MKPIYPQLILVCPSRVALGVLLARCRKRTPDDRARSDRAYRACPVGSGLCQTCRSGRDVCVYFTFTCQTANSQAWWCYDVGSLWSDEVMRMEPSLMNKINALIKKTPGQSLALLPHKGTMKNLQTQREPSADQTGTLTLNF